MRGGDEHAAKLVRAVWAGDDDRAAARLGAGDAESRSVLAHIKAKNIQAAVATA